MLGVGVRSLIYEVSVSLTPMRLIFWNSPLDETVGVDVTVMGGCCGRRRVVHYDLSCHYLVNCGFLRGVEFALLQVSPKMIKSHCSVYI